MYVYSHRACDLAAVRRDVCLYTVNDITFHSSRVPRASEKVVMFNVYDLERLSSVRSWVPNSLDFLQKREDKCLLLFEMERGAIKFFVYCTALSGAIIPMRVRMKR